MLIDRPNRIGSSVLAMRTSCVSVPDSAVMLHQETISPRATGAVTSMLYGLAIFGVVIPSAPIRHTYGIGNAHTIIAQVSFVRQVLPSTTDRFARSAPDVGLGGASRSNCPR